MVAEALLATGFEPALGSTLGRVGPYSGKKPAANRASGFLLFYPTLQIQQLKSHKSGGL